MAVFLSPLGGVGAQFFDSNGNPLREYSQPYKNYKQLSSLCHSTIFFIRSQGSFIEKKVKNIVDDPETTHYIMSTSNEAKRCKRSLKIEYTWGYGPAKR